MLMGVSATNSHDIYTVVLSLYAITINVQKGRMVMEKKMKLEVKDLMTIGIFATIYIVVKIIVGFVGVIPILCVILPMITAVVCAPIYMLFVTKAEKFGMITLLAAVVGAVMMIAGYGWLTLVVSFVCGHRRLFWQEDHEKAF